MPLRIIHTADWHIGQTFYDFDRTAEHEHFLKWLVGQLPLLQPDALLISGDVFDVSNPSAQAQRLFYNFLKEANAALPHLQIVVTAGNHDSAARLEAPQALLDAFNTRVVGVVPRQENRNIDYARLLLPLYNRQGEIAAQCLAIPFLRLGDYPAQAGSSYTQGVSLLYQEAYEYALSQRQAGQAILAMGHLHAMSAAVSEEDRSERAIVGGVEFVPLDTFHEGLAYTALGHIHRPQKLGKEHLRYSGSPLPMSFSEKKYAHQIVLVDIEGEKAVRIEPVLLPILVPLLKVPDRPLPLAEVLETLEKLPSDTPAPFPYLEIPVLLQGPEPSLKHRIEEALKGKAVRLAKISTSYPKKSGESTDMPSTASLQDMKPVDVFEKIYRQKYQTDVPEAMKALFAEVEGECRWRDANDG